MKPTLLLFLIVLSVQVFPQGINYSLSTEPDIDYGELKDNFNSVPEEYKMRVWWFWMNGVATKESITQDIEAMKDNFIAGALLVDNGAPIGPIGPTFMSREWKDLFAHAVKEASRLGIELSVNIQSGCGDPGNPEIKPDNGMKKIVFSEKEVTGPGRIQTELPQPPSQIYYQDILVQAFKRDPVNDNDTLYIAHDQITDLSDNFSEGILTWDVPEGKWTVIRYGMTSTGKRNNYASPGYRGGLCYDQMNERGIKAHWNEVAQPLLDIAERSGNSVKFVHTDSWEMGMTDWTHDFMGSFKERRGYDIKPYLPVLAGRIVTSREISERFREDFFLTVGDLITEENYRVFKDMAYSNGVFLHSESAGPHMPPIDALRNLGINDIPVGEFWVRANTHRVSEKQRLHIKQTSCAAHIYGRRFCAAEAPTSVGPQWQRSPRDLKSLFDRAFCDGVNRIFWHTYTSSPDEYGIPGVEYFAGTHLNRHVTWWDQSGSFIKYINRSQMMLTQGLFTADILYYYGSGVPKYIFLDSDVEGVPYGYQWDACNSDVLLSRAEAKNGRIYLPDGMSYPLLVIAEQKSISLDVLNKIEKMVREGIILVGSPPERAHGLSGYPESDNEVKTIVKNLWGDIDQKTIFKNDYGKGRVYSGLTIAQVLKKEEITPDFSYAASPDVEMEYIHRSSGDLDIYYITNKWARHGISDYTYRYLTDLPDRYIQAVCSFRIDGKRDIERWDPVTGKITPVQVYQYKNNRINIPVSLSAEGSAFFVFRKSKESSHITQIEKDGNTLIAGNDPLIYYSSPLVVNQDQAELLEKGKYKIIWDDGNTDKIENYSIPEEIILDGIWKIEFMERSSLGDPITVETASLRSWTDFEERAIKYFSGTARYSKTFELNDSWISKGRVYLDLGNVQELATVKVNGTEVITCWIAPFRADITDYLKEGENILEVDVTNLWSNRLIGDGMLPEEDRKTHTNLEKNERYPYISPDSGKHLRVSGLLGTVRLQFSEIYTFDRPY